MKVRKCFLLTIAGVIALIALASVRVSAAPPANDNFANAQLLTGTFGSVTTNTAEATKQAGEPFHGWNPGGKSLWYRFVAPSTGILTVDTVQSNFDTLLGVYQGTTFNDLKTLVTNDDIQNLSINGGYLSRAVLGVQSGQTYFIAIDGFAHNGVAESGPLTLSYQLTFSPENDNFGTAVGYDDLMPFDGDKTQFVTNLGGTREPGEPIHAGNTGGNSIWFRFSNFSFPERSITFTLDGKSIADPSAGIPSQFAIYAGTELANLTPLARTYIPAGQTGRLTVKVAPDQKILVAVDGYDQGSGPAVGNFRLTYGPTKTLKTPEIDGDGRADISVFRPSTGTFYTHQSVYNGYRAFQWGTAGDKPLVNHWDFDRQPDYTVYRPNTQFWHIGLSSNSTDYFFHWGVNTDIPLTFNQFLLGTNYCYAANFRPATGTWYIRTNNSSITFQFGLNGDRPITADFDGDGTDEIAVFRPSDGNWYFADPFTGAFIKTVHFGLNGDRPVPADYDGDGKTDVAVYRPSTGYWYYQPSHTGGMVAVPFGLPNDIPQPANYHRTEYDNIAVFRPSDGNWYILNSNLPGSSYSTVPFGSPGDIPVTAPIY